MAIVPKRFRFGDFVKSSEILCLCSRFVHSRCPLFTSCSPQIERENEPPTFRRVPWRAALFGFPGKVHRIDDAGFSFFDPHSVFRHVRKKRFEGVDWKGVQLALPTRDAGRL